MNSSPKKLPRFTISKFFRARISAEVSLNALFTQLKVHAHTETKKKPEVISSIRNQKSSYFKF